METINNVQLKEVVRDFLLTPNPSQPLLIWGRPMTGKMTIIDGVVEEMKFYKLLNNEDKYGRFDIRKIEILKSLKIDIGSFDTDSAEKFAFENFFSCYRMIFTPQSDKPHIIIQGDIRDEDNDNAIISAVNQQCNALAYKYELTLQDWCEWATETRRIHPYIVHFVKQHPQWFYDCPKGSVSPVSPYKWEAASNEIYMSEEDLSSGMLNTDSFLNELRMSGHVYYPLDDFKSWLQNGL